VLPTMPRLSPVRAVETGPTLGHGPRLGCDDGILHSLAAGRAACQRRRQFRSSDVKLPDGPDSPPVGLDAVPPAGRGS